MKALVSALRLVLSLANGNYVPLVHTTSHALHKLAAVQSRIRTAFSHATLANTAADCQQICDLFWQGRVAGSWLLEVSRTHGSRHGHLSLPGLPSLCQGASQMESEQPCRVHRPGIVSSAHCTR